MKAALGGLLTSRWFWWARVGKPLALRIRQAGICVVQRQFKTTEETTAAYALMDALW